MQQLGLHDPKDELDLPKRREVLYRQRHIQLTRILVSRSVHLTTPQQALSSFAILGQRERGHLG